MATLMDMVAAVVVHSSAVAFSHFGVTVDTPKAEAPPPAAERVIARTPSHKVSATSSRAVDKIAAACPDAPASNVHRI